MSMLAHSSSPILNPDRNPLLRWLLKRTFYAQFCAGENAKEVKETVDELKRMGYQGVILAYAKEEVVKHSAAKALGDRTVSGEAAEKADREAKTWRDATLETVRMTASGDFVALKFTGAGPQAFYHLAHGLPPSAALEQAIVDVCNLSSARGVRLLFDAEQQAVQAGIDAWTLDFMRRYNIRNVTVYGTYQAYLKATPLTLARHLSAARNEGFILGVKLVRGAYLALDPRHLIHDTKEDTDACYDGIAESLMRRSYNNVLSPLPGEGDSEFPDVGVVLASHNHTSVRKAQKLRASQTEAGQDKIDMVYAQLLGMADEVSCALLQARFEGRKNKTADLPKAYKYFVWGSTGECMKYLLRRAEENRDAFARTREGRDALARELWRRMRRSIGLSN
ncbi:MAG: proline dehydrogenase [Piccolia ochrophora]|nr:MAG: proline dehydrogenase [Piccolia ochrophora]